MKTRRRVEGHFTFLRLDYCSKVLEIAEGLSFPQGPLCLAEQTFSSTWFKISTADRNV